MTICALLSELIRLGEADLGRNDPISRWANVGIGSNRRRAAVQTTQLSPPSAYHLRLSKSSRRGTDTIIGGSTGLTHPFLVALIRRVRPVGFSRLSANGNSRPQLHG